MRTPHTGLIGFSWCAVVLSCSIASCAQTLTPEPHSAAKTAQAANVGEVSKPEQSTLPDSPGATLADLQQPEAEGQTAVAQLPNSAGAQPGTEVPQTSQDQKPQRPVGTAAAEAPKVSGITAAQPAGVAIAPAKQHRVRTIVLKAGAIIGAGAALGTVIALTAATPSKPPGAH